MFKISIQKFHILLFQFRVTADFYAISLQTFFQICIGCILTLCQQFYLFKNRIELLLTGHICLVIPNIL